MDTKLAVRLTLALMAGLMLIACAATAPQPTVSVVPPTSALAASPISPTNVAPTAKLPILYTDIVEQGGSKRAVTKAVDAGGQAPTNVADSYGSTWSPDGKTFAYVNADGTKLVQQSLNAQGKTIFSAKSDEKFRRLPTWSPDGTRIAIISRSPTLDDGKQVIVIQDAQEIARYELPPLGQEHVWNPNKFRWSPDGKKILLSWDYTIVIHTDTNQIETVSNQRVLAEWAPDSSAVYYFDLVTPGLPYGDFGDWNIKKLGGAAPTVLMKQAQVSALGLHTNLSAFDVRTTNLQFNRGLLSLSPAGDKLLLVSGLDTGSRFSFYAIAPDGTFALDHPEKTIETDSSTGAVEWSPDETQLAVISLGGKGEPDAALKVLDLRSATWTLLQPIGIKLPSYRFEEQLSLITTISSKILSWAQ